MKIHIFCAGRTPRPYEQAWIEEYLKRGERFAKIQFLRVRESPDKDRWIEIESKIPPSSWRIVLDDKGKLYTTKEWVDLFGRVERERKGVVSFLIGGAYGLPERLQKTADTTLSLSPLTLPHRIALLVLCEQIYRVLTVRTNAPYHHA